MDLEGLLRPDPRDREVAGVHSQVGGTGEEVRARRWGTRVEAEQSLDALVTLADEASQGPPSSVGSLTRC